MATQTHLNQFSSLEKSLSSIDFSRIYREELGPASFVSLKEVLEDIQTKISRSAKFKEVLSDHLLQQLNGILAKLYNLLRQVVSYNETQFVTNKAQVQNSIISFNEQLLAIWPQIVAIINDTDKTIEIEQALDQLNNLWAKMQEDAKNIENIKTMLSSDLKSFEERYKNELFAKAELIKQEDNFSMDAKAFRNASFWWLAGVAFTTIVLLVLLVVLLRNFCFEMSCFQNVSQLNYDKICEDCNRSILNLEIFKAVSYRILIISFILYLVAVCLKNYNASMHNYTINKHKANSLAAALVLLEKSKTNEGNDQIMTQAASAIFSHQPTGYNNKDPENISSTLTSKIIEKVSPDK